MRSTPEVRTLRAGPSAGRGPWRTGARIAVILVCALAGAWLAILVAGEVDTEIGPFDATVSARPSLTGHTEVELPPLGSIRLDTHHVPLAIAARVDRLRVESAEQVASDPSVLQGLGDEVAGDARTALVRVALRGILVAAAGGALGALAAARRWRAAIAGSLLASVVAGLLAVGTARTFDADAVAEPEFSGLLTVAPNAVGDVQRVIDRFGEYRAQLADLVGNVASLYEAAQGLPTFDPDDRMIRVLHVSDIHLNPEAFDLIDLLVERFGVDVVADTGDLTDWGTEPESQLVTRIAQVGVPYLWVRGNHDSAATARAVAAQPNAIVLDGQAAVVAGLRFWGVADRRYTPNKDQPTGREAEQRGSEAAAPGVAQRLRHAEPPQVDLVLVHDPTMAARLGGRVPLVLAGHTHRFADRRLGTTRLLVEGTTGGAGLRALQGEAPAPLSCSVLYFDADTDELVAYDRVTVGGLGEAAVQVDRQVVRNKD